MLEKFEAHFKPQTSEVFERFKFLRRHRQPGEKFDSWIVQLRNMVKSCNYGSIADSLLRDVIVLGISDTSVREKLLFEQELDLQTACEIARASEASKTQTAEISVNRESATVHRLIDENRRMETTNANASKVWRCKSCGRSHGKDSCRASGVICHNCGKVGHFARTCDNQPKRPQQSHHKTPRERVHAVGGGDEESDEFPRSHGEYVLMEISTAVGDREWYTKLLVDRV